MQGRQRAGGVGLLGLRDVELVALQRRLARRDIDAVVGERHGGDVVAVRLVEADAHRADRAAVGIGRQADAQLLPGAEVEGEIRDERRLDGGGGLVVGAFAHQHLSKRRAFRHRQHLVLDAQVVARVGLRQERHVLRRNGDRQRAER